MAAWVATGLVRVLAIMAMSAAAVAVVKAVMAKLS
jgi:hypothetical protein